LAALTVPALAAPFNAPEGHRPVMPSSGKWARAVIEMNQSTACLMQGNPLCATAQAADLLRRVEGQPLFAQLAAVNRWVNAHAYVADARNWGQEDYWAGLSDFLARSGDCEDFAAAKYALLRALGVPAHDMRVVIVNDTVTRVTHAVLTVTTPRGVMVLDNQDPDVLPDTVVRRYTPVLSLNEQGVWLRMAPQLAQRGQPAEPAPAGQDD
jgi:predicted transglutaminase-like cysteine proteinase